MNIDFLSLEDVLQIHSIQLDRFGGGEGLRDIKLLESAIFQPQSTFDGEYLHRSLFEMGAAYLFHIVKNHPFVDGNKRTGLGCCLVFLELNGIQINKGTAELYDVTIKVASSEYSKEKIAEKLYSLSCL